MAKFEFDLSYEDTQRVFALKKEAGMNDMTGNEYAKYLLERTLYNLYPEQVKLDEDGVIIPRNKK
ncbi:MAG: hypothetical protein IKS98_13290 [Lachnospiraceae bacterium]|nr:hypothetical protein [Lachnospiraceae bacterium]